jgi:hypothetical protein
LSPFYWSKAPVKIPITKALPIGKKIHFIVSFLPEQSPVKISLNLCFAFWAK